MTRYIFTFFLIFFISKSVFGQRENAFALKGSIWTTRTIEVTWENPSDDNAAEREWVRQAIQNSWESVADIKFTNWGKANSFSRGIRIRIKDDENDGPRTLGLGKVLDGKKDGNDNIRGSLSCTSSYIDMDCKARPLTLNLISFKYDELIKKINNGDSSQSPHQISPNC